MGSASQARKTIGRIIRKREGGVYGLASECGVHFTRIYAFLRGGGLDPKNAGALRAALPEVPTSVWVDAFVPLPEGEAGLGGLR